MIPERLPRAILFFTLLVFAIGYVAAFFSYGYIHGDEGIALTSGWRIAMGERHYLDYFEGIAPFSFLVTGLVFKLFGASWIVARSLVLAYALVLVFSADLLLRRLGAGWLSRLAMAAFLVPFGVYYWPIPSHHWMVAITQLLCLAWLLKGLDINPARNGFLAGAMAALAVFSMQDQGAYLVIALPVLFFPWIEAPGTRKQLFFGWVCGGIAVTVVFMAYLLSYVSLSEVFYQSFQFSLERYTVNPGNRGTLANLGLQQIGTQPWREHLAAFPAFTVGQTAMNILVPLLPVIALALLVAGFFRTRPRSAVTGALLAGSLAFLGGALHRFSLTYLVWAAPMFLVVILWKLGNGEPRAGFSRFALAAVMVIAALYCVGNYRLTTATPRVPVTGPAGTLQVPDNSTQSSMQLLLDAIERHVPEGAPLIVTEYNAMVYFWSQRRNPSRHNTYIWPHMHTDEQAAEMIDTLERNPDTHVLLFVPFNDGDPFATHVVEHMRPVWQVPGVVLMAPVRQ